MSLSATGRQIGEVKGDLNPHSKDEPEQNYIFVYLLWQQMVTYTDLYTGRNMYGNNNYYRLLAGSTYICKEGFIWENRVVFIWFGCEWAM